MATSRRPNWRFTGPLPKTVSQSPLSSIPGRDTTTPPLSIFIHRSLRGPSIGRRQTQPKKRNKAAVNTKDDATRSQKPTVHLQSKQVQHWRQNPINHLALMNWVSSFSRGSK
ncbi:hypothetical protein Bca4012_086560 [Brassica carinata]